MSLPIPDGAEVLASITGLWETNEDEVLVSSVGRKKKREKSEEESPKEESGSQFRKKRRDETEEKVVSQLQAAIVNMFALAKQLKKLEEATPNTKVEIKTKIAEVLRCAEGIDKKSRRWQSALARKMLPSKPRAAKEVIRPKGVDCGTQTVASSEGSGERAAARVGDISGENRYGEIKAALQMGGNFLDFQKISELRWPKELFSQTAEEKTDLLSKGWDWDIVLPVAGDFCMEGRDAARVRERYQGVAVLQAQGSVPDRVAYLIEDVRFPGGDKNRKRRFCYYPVVTGDSQSEWNRETVLQTLTVLKAMVLEQDRSCLVVSSEGKLKFMELRKMLEFLFSGTEIKIVLVSGKLGYAKDGAAKAAEGENEDRGKKRSRPPRDDALIIRADIKKCYRCWGAGHEKTACKGPDRTTLCHRCGGGGHQANLCDRDPYCPVCVASGHRTLPRGVLFSGGRWEDRCKCLSYSKLISEVARVPKIWLASRQERWVRIL